MNGNVKPLLAIIGGVLTIFGGEVLKQSLTSWADIYSLSFIAGFCVQLGGLIAAIAGGIAYTKVGNGVKILIPFVLLAGLLSLSACGPKDVNLTPQAKVAKYGAAIVETFQVACDTTTTLANQGTVPKAVAGQILIRCNQAGQLGQTLSAALAQYDQATAGEQPKILPAVRAAFDGLSKLAVQILQDAKLPGVAGQIATLAGQIVETLNQLAALFQWPLVPVTAPAGA